jgi:Undecaprenyl-phosphate glucose phosphotransferase
MRFINYNILANGHFARSHPGLGDWITTLRDPPDETRHASPRQTPFRCSRVSPEVIACVVGVADFCLVIAGTASAFLVYSYAIGDPQLGRYIITAISAATLFVIGLGRLRGYKLKQLMRLHAQLTQILLVWSGTVSVLLLVAFIEKTSESYSRGWALGSIFVTAIFLIVGRCIFYALINRWVRDGLLARRIAIVGAGDEGQRLVAKFRQLNDPSFVICGIFDDQKSRTRSSIHELEGTTDDLIRLVRCNAVDEVIVALPLDAQHRLTALFHKIKGVACDLHLSAEPIAQSFQIRGMSYVGNVPMLAIADRPLKHWHYVTKWIEDKALAGIFLVFLAPVFAIAALAVKIDSRGPAFFVQRRFGFNNNVIRVIKFRTMHVQRCDESGAQRTIRSDPRVTRVGRILRWLSLDELPQLVNVLRGDMSLVGPRPHAIAMKVGDRLYCEAVELYLHRHRVKPGITGLAQVNGLRGEVDTLDKARARVAQDLYYIEHWSLWLDLKILFKTGGVLASREHSY